MPSTYRLVGNAPSVAQVDSYTPATITVGNDFTLTCNGKTLTFRATAATAANVADGLKALVDATTIPEFQEVSASSAGGVLYLTGRVRGRSFTITSSAAVGAGSGTPTLTRASVTAVSGPGYFGIATNWITEAGSTGVPTTGDTIVLDGSIPLTGDLDQNTVTLAAIYLEESHTADVGLPRHNGVYREYRETDLKIGATAIYCRSNSRRIRINTGSVQTTITVDRTGASAEPNVPTFSWIGTHASNVVNVNRGSFGAAPSVGQVATIATTRIGWISNQESDANVLLGAGCTLTTIVKSGGRLEVNSGVTTATHAGGEMEIRGASNITTLNVDGGKCYYSGSGTITTLSIGSGGRVDFTRSLLARNVTTVNLYEGFQFVDTYRTVTVGAGKINLIRCGIGPGSGNLLDLGENIQLTAAAL